MGRIIAKEVRRWLAVSGVETLYLEPGGPWESAYSESFNSRLRDELLKGESFASLKEAQVLLNAWRRAYNEERPHSWLGDVAPAVFAKKSVPADAASLHQPARLE